jgi:hypothetical protein
LNNFHNAYPAICSEQRSFRTFIGRYMLFIVRTLAHGPSRLNLVLRLALLPVRHLKKFILDAYSPPFISTLYS